MMRGHGTRGLPLDHQHGEESMAGNIVHFEINAKDASRAKRFYSSVFGWKYKDSAMPGIEYYLIDGVTPGGAINPLTEPSKTKAPTVYFGTDDIDKTLKTIKDSGGTTEKKAPIPGQGWFAAGIAPVEDHRAATLHENVVLVEIVVVQGVVDPECGQRVQSIGEPRVHRRESSAFVGGKTVRTPTRDLRLTRDDVGETSEQPHSATIRRAEPDDLVGPWCDLTLQACAAREDLAPRAKQLIAGVHLAELLSTLGHEH